MSEMPENLEDSSQLPEQATASTDLSDPGTGPDAFVAQTPMEQDPEELFAGDRGVLDPAVRRVLVRLLQRRVVFAERHPDDWAVLIDHQQVIESRLHDLFVRLIVDLDRGVAYKQQVRSDSLEVPVLLRDEAYNRAETLVLVYLRTVYQREATAGEPAVRIDVEEIEQTVLSYFTDTDGNQAARQRTIDKALNRLRNEGIIDEESEGRYVVTPLVEVVLSADRLAELQRWLKQQVAQPAAPAATAVDAAPAAQPAAPETPTDVHAEDLSS